MHTGSDRQTMVVMEASGWCGGGGGGGGGGKRNPSVFSRSKRIPLFADFSPKKTTK